MFEWLGAWTVRSAERSWDNCAGSTGSSYSAVAALLREAAWKNMKPRPLVGCSPVDANLATVGTGRPGNTTWESIELGATFERGTDSRCLSAKNISNRAKSQEPFWACLEVSQRSDHPVIRVPVRRSRSRRRRRAPLGISIKAQHVVPTVKVTKTDFSEISI